MQPLRQCIFQAIGWPRKRYEPSILQQYLHGNDLTQSPPLLPRWRGTSEDVLLRRNLSWTRDHFAGIICFYYHGMPIEDEQRLDHINSVLTVLFVVGAP